MGIYLGLQIFELYLLRLVILRCYCCLIEKMKCYLLCACFDE